MFSPNVINGVLQSRFDEITTHLNHQLSFSPLSNKGHVLVDDKFYDFEVDNDGHLFSPQKLEGYDFYQGKSYLGHYNDMNFSPNGGGGDAAGGNAGGGAAVGGNAGGGAAVGGNAAQIHRTKIANVKRRILNIIKQRGFEKDLHYEMDSSRNVVIADDSMRKWILDNEPFYQLEKAYNVVIDTDDNVIEITDNDYP